MALIGTRHRIFDIVIDNQLYEVWDLPGKEHLQGEWDGCPKTWWVRYVEPEFNELDRLTQLLRSNEIRWIPYTDHRGTRPQWEVRVKTGNYIKSKWGDTDIHQYGFVEMFCNLRKVYEFPFHNDLSYAFGKAQQLIVEMNEHPFRFRDPEQEIGRKIWYYEQPAVIESLMLDQGAIMIRKDDPNNPNFDLSRPWDREEDMPIVDEWNNEPVVKEDIFSSHIHWFRD